MKKSWKKFKIFWRELGNVITNLLCPIISILCAFAELFQLPDETIKTLKKLEIWLFYVSGTQKSLNSLGEVTDKALEDDNIDIEEALEITESTLKATKQAITNIPKE